MKYGYRIVTLVITLVFMVFQSHAQIEIPSPSPTATFSQKVGLTTISITYSRPGKKDREVFGGLVPYNELWRTGANSATKVEFSDDVKINGKELKAGTYALFTIPGEKEWTVIFSTKSNQGGTEQYKQEEDALRVTVAPVSSPTTVETFTIMLQNVTNTSADLQLSWENVIVNVPVEVAIDEKIMASIDQNLTIQPGNYYQAAVYYHESGKDLNQALDWINQGIAIWEKGEQNIYWVYRRKSQIQADMKNYKEAIVTAEICKKKAQEAGNDQYVKYSEDSIAEWKKM